MSTQSDNNPTAMPWRTGRKVGRTIYLQRDDEPSDDDSLIGVMDSPELAEAAVQAHNFQVPRPTSPSTPTPANRMPVWTFCDECAVSPNCRYNRSYVAYVRHACLLTFAGAPPNFKARCVECENWL